VLLENKLVKIINSEGLEQPLGGWGRLQILENGQWSGTGRVSRILPDGSVDNLNTSGGTVMVEGLIGREFVDLAELETRLNARPGISRAGCFVAYNPDNTIKVFAQVESSEQNAEIWDQGKIKTVIEHR